MKGLYIALLLLWLAGGTYMANKKYCGTKKAPAAASSVAAASGGAKCDKTINFDDGDFSVSSEDNFTFKINKADMVRPSDKLADFLTAVAAYLNDNPDNTVLVTGQYSAKESKPGGFENLGLARASSIKNFLEQSYKVPTDQIRVGSEQLSNCFSKETKTLRKGAVFTSGVK